MSIPTAAERPRALLAAIQLPGVSDQELASSLEELRRLVLTLGYQPVGKVWQKKSGVGSAAVFGEGKLLELASWTGGTGVIPKGPQKKLNKARAAAAEEEEEDDLPEALEPEDDDGEGSPADQAVGRADVVVVDHELSPMQLRNLERALDCEVIDRTGVIVEIFHRHASSREARLQVEIARLTYVAPRLRETGGGERQKGGIGQKGAGESSVELDRRKIRDRIAELRAELASIEGERETRRAKRKEQLRVALVGYTNAGKSSMMRALTGSEVYVADKLFATLDTTVRALHPETRPRILVSDTVGFIKKLPHDLVASFRSTLDEALEASLLLHVVDAADPDFRNQLRVTREVLADIGADDVPSRLVLNKIDKVSPEEREALWKEFPDAIQTSAKDPDEIKRVRQLIIDAFEADMPEAELVVPYAASKVIGEVHKANVLSQSYEDDGVHFKIRASQAVIDRIKSLLA
jgi:GTP-binding protein HflX